MPVYEHEDAGGQLDETLLTDRLIALLSAGFGLLATLLASIGLYGVMAFVVAAPHARSSACAWRSAREPGGVIWLVMREVLLLLGDRPGDRHAGRDRARDVTSPSQLYGIQAHDPWMAVATIVLLSLVSAAAGLIPARRASRIDPILALRYE